MDGLGNEDWSYDGIYDGVRSKDQKDQIVDGIDIESFDFSMKKTKEEHLEERTFEEDSTSYLDRISELLKEWNKLDKMLQQTSSEIKDEKDKKQRIKELRAKIKEVEELMQK